MTQSLTDDFHELALLEDSILKAGQAHDAISQYGLTPTETTVLQRSGFLTSVSLESLCVKGQNEETTGLALESLGSTIVEKATQWSAKIIQIISNRWKSYLESSQTLNVWLVKKFATLSGSDLKDTDKAKTFVKVHPVGKILTAVETALAAVGIIVFGVGGIKATLKASTRLPFLKGLVGKINALKWPFGKITAAISNHGKLSVAVGSVVAAGGYISLQDAGYTQDKLHTLKEMSLSGLAKFKEGFPTIRDNTVSVVTTVGTVAKASYQSGKNGFKIFKGNTEQSPSINPSLTRGGEWSLVAGSIANGAGVVGAAIGASIPIIGAVIYGLLQLFTLVVLKVWELLKATLLGISPGRYKTKEFV